jgi:hypothetical protein
MIRHSRRKRRFGAVGAAVVALALVSYANWAHAAESAREAADCATPPGAGTQRMIEEVARRRLPKYLARSGIGAQFTFTFHERSFRFNPAHGLWGLPFTITDQAAGRTKNMIAIVNCGGGIEFSATD